MPMDISKYRAMEEFLDREEANTLLRRLLSAELDLPGAETLSNAEVRIILGEAKERIEGRAEDIEREASEARDPHEDYPGCA